MDTQEKITALLEKIVPFLLEKSYRVVTAESFTGGMLADLFTNIANSSHFFQGGVVAYDPLIKQELLGVQQSSMKRFGLVSEAVVEQMALGALKRFSAKNSPATLALATSGVAGPSGGTEQIPVGTMVLGVAWFLPSELGQLGDSAQVRLSPHLAVEKTHYDGTRQEIKKLGCCRLLELITEYLM